MGDLKVNDMWVVIGVGVGGEPGSGNQSLSISRCRQSEQSFSFLIWAKPSRSQQPRGRTGWQRPGKGFRGRGSASRRGCWPGWWKVRRHGLYTDPGSCDCGDSSLLPASRAPCLQPEGGSLEEKPQPFYVHPAPGKVQTQNFSCVTGNFC